MLAPSIGLILLASAALTECRSVVDLRDNHGLLAHKRQKNDQTATVLAADAIQSGSFTDGSQDGVAAAGQSKSRTSKNNFINFCAGKKLTNGLQALDGSCNGIVMGELPSKENMVSSMITFPLTGSATLESETTFSIQVQMSNIVPGSFTNPQLTYYSAPQALSGGKIVGHTHVTVQDLGKNLNPKKPLDATKFVFFKGINDAGDGNGLLSATVTGGLPAGNYRVCTMASSSNHQAVLMPVAQRGAQDDCTKFTIIQAGGQKKDGDGENGNGASSSEPDSDKVSKTIDISTSDGAESSTSSPILTTSTARFSNSTIAATRTRKGGNGGKGRGNGGNGRDNDALTKTLNSSQAAANGNVGPQATPTKANNDKVGGSVSSSTVAAETSAKKATTDAEGGRAVAGTTQVIKIVHKVTIIKTFFKFVSSLGGLPPSVNKQGKSFFVLDELFDDLNSACDAACGHQFKTCISFSGPGFSFQECEEQMSSCGSAASTESAKVPTELTATVIVPPAASSLPGTVISEETITSTIVATTPIENPQAPAATKPNEGVAAPGDSSTDCVVTATVTVDGLSDKATPAASSTDIPFPPNPSFSNSTSSATASLAPSASSVAPESSSALAGIDAPAVLDSGDATRPFLVNGNTFVNKAAAVQRSCDIQFNKCADAVNLGRVTGVTVGDCAAQKTACGK